MEVPTSPSSIIASISSHSDEGWKAPADADGPATIPEPDERPDEHAQWDEAHGRWIVWDAASEAWVPTPIAAPPAATDPVDRDEPDEGRA